MLLQKIYPSNSTIYYQGEFELALESNRMLGFIGALLIVVGTVSQILSVVHFFFPLVSSGVVGLVFPSLGLIGFVLFMVAMKGFANDYGDPSIFDNALYGLVSSIILGVAAVALMIALVFLNFDRIIGTITPGLMPSISSLPELPQSILSDLSIVLLIVECSCFGLQVT